MKIMFMSGFSIDDHARARQDAGHDLWDDSYTNLAGGRDGSRDKRAHRVSIGIAFSLLLTRMELVKTFFCRLLDDLGQGVDKTDSKLSGQLKKIKRFIRQTEGMSSDLFIPSTRLIELLRDEKWLVHCNSNRHPMYSTADGHSRMIPSGFASML